MALTKITKSGITNSAVDNNKIEADAVDATKIADNAISEEHLDTTAILGNTELAEVANSNDILLIYDASAGTIKKILASNVGTQAVTLSSVSPTNALTGDGTGNQTFTITGTNLTGASAVLVTSGGTEVDFDSVTVDSATQITAVIANSSLSNANEPYDIKVYGSNGLTAVLRNQINVDASPVFVTSAGSLGVQTGGTPGSFSVNATDPDSAGNVTFELQSGSLPPGYTLTNTAAEGGTAIIAGTDNTTSSTTTFNFVLRAVDAASNTTSRSFSITSSVIQSTSFTSSGTFSVPSGITTLSEVLVIGGGGGGGTAAPTPQPGQTGGGGGGAGGLIYMPNYPVTPGGTITVTVGCGGGQGSNGQQTTFGSPGDPGLACGGVLLAKEGGAGASTFNDGNAGGSGGGALGPGTSGGSGLQPTQPGNSGAYGFGRNGGPGVGKSGGARGGGGAGAGPVDAGCGGGQPGQGGGGKSYTIADGTTPVAYAGGGGGGGGSPGETFGGAGSPCGTGGAGGFTGGSQSGAGTANRGGGAGGGGAGQCTGGPGGKGIVIIRYG